MSLNQTETVTENQVRALKDCIFLKIKTFKDKGTKNKRGAIFAQVVLITFSVITPVLIGWKNDKNETITLLINLALISSGITAAFSALQTFFDWKELWTNYKIAKNGLETIVAEMDYLISNGYENINQQDMTELFNRYKDICAKMDENYKNVRTSEASSGSAPDSKTP